MNQNALLQKLIGKVVVKRFMNNVSRMLSVHGIRNGELSLRAGKQENAFSKTLNEAEDLRLSSLLRYWHAATSLAEAKGVNVSAFLDFDSCFDQEARSLLGMMKEIGEEDWQSDSSRISLETMVGLKVYVEILYKQKAVSQAEMDEFLTMIEQVRGGTS